MLLSSDHLVTEDFATWLSVFLSTPEPLTHCVTFIVIYVNNHSLTFMTLTTSKTYVNLDLFSPVFHVNADTQIFFFGVFI